MVWAKTSMSEASRRKSRIVPADEAEQLRRWAPDAFAQPSQQAVTRRQPLTLAQKIAAEEAAQRLRAGHPAGRRPDPIIKAPPAPPPPPKPAVDPAEVARIRKSAFDEGYAAGYDQGARAAQQETERLRELAQTAGSVFSRLESDLAPHVLTLSIEIARQVLRRELSVNAEAIVAVVRDAFNQLTGGETGRQLLLNPDDVQLVRAHLGEDLALGAWKIIEDPGITPGGCRVATQQALIDATVQTRWKRTVSALGADAAWPGADEDADDA